MSTVALTQAVSMADQLMNAEFKGRGDREKTARYRLSKKTGVPESYLFRLTYKAREMGDVKGEWYRLLKQHYEAWCVANEAAADRYDEERLKIEDNHEATQKPNGAAVGMAASQIRKDEEA